MPLNVALLMVIALLAGGISLAKKAGGPPADYAIQVQVHVCTCTVILKSNASTPIILVTMCRSLALMMCQSMEL